MVSAVCVRWRILEITLERSGGTEVASLNKLSLSSPPTVHGERSHTTMPRSIVSIGNPRSALRMYGKLHLLIVTVSCKSSAASACMSLMLSVTETVLTSRSEQRDVTPLRELDKVKVALASSIPKQWKGNLALDPDKGYCIIITAAPRATLSSLLRLLRRTVCPVALPHFCLSSCPSCPCPARPVRADDLRPASDFDPVLFPITSSPLLSLASVDATEIQLKRSCRAVWQLQLWSGGFSRDAG
jgi:hypothetical protein